MTTPERNERYRTILWMAFAAMFTFAVAHGANHFSTVTLKGPLYPPDGTVYVFSTSDAREFECAVRQRACTFAHVPPLADVGVGCLRLKSEPPSVCSQMENQYAWYSRQFEVAGAEQTTKPKRRAVGWKK